MVAYKDALVRLRSNYDVEETVVQDLAIDFIDGIENVQGIDAKTKDSIVKLFNQLSEDSKRHESMIKELIEYIEHKGEGDF